MSFEYYALSDRKNASRGLRHALSLLSALLLLAQGCTPRLSAERGVAEGSARGGRVLSVETGTGSWYGGKYHGRKTASGEVFDQHALTAAHRSLPFGTRVRVSNLAKDRSVILRINDRGPFIRGRVIDVSRRAAVELGFLHEGLAELRIEVLASGS